MNQRVILSQHRLLTALGRKHPDRYVAMVNGQVLAVGRDQFAVLKKARKMVPDKKETVGLFYLPGKKKHLYLLKNSR